MVTPATFILRYPEFAAVDPAVIQMSIDDATPYFNTCRWGAFLDQGMAALTAYLLTSNAVTAAPVVAGTTSSAALDATIMIKAGDVQQSFDPVLLGKVVADPFLSNSYGQRYVYLRDNMIIGGPITV